LINKEFMFNDLQKTIDLGNSPFDVYHDIRCGLVHSNEKGTNRQARIGLNFT